MTKNIHIRLHLQLSAEKRIGSIIAFEQVVIRK